MCQDKNVCKQNEAMKNAIADSFVFYYFSFFSLCSEKLIELCFRKLLTILLIAQTDYLFCFQFYLLLPYSVDCCMYTE